jgi:hypothetical protein
MVENFSHLGIMEMIFNEKAFAEAMYASLSKNLKEKIRPWYPEIDSLSEADAIELCLAFGRAQSILFRHGA